MLSVPNPILYKKQFQPCPYSQLFPQTNSVLFFVQTFRQPDKIVQLMEEMLICRNEAGTVCYRMLSPLFVRSVADRTYSPCQRPKALSLLYHFALVPNCRMCCVQQHLTRREKTKVNRRKWHAQDTTARQPFYRYNISVTGNNHPTGRCPAGTVPALAPCCHHNICTCWHNSWLANSGLANPQIAHQASCSYSCRFPEIPSVGVEPAGAPGGAVG